MVLEVRRIILSRDEFSSALVSYRRANERAIPAGVIIGCEVNREASALVKFQPAGEAANDATISPAMLTDVLIRFCLENNIALPRSGKKRAVGHAGQAALEIHTEDAELIETKLATSRGAEPKAGQARAAS